VIVAIPSAGRPLKVKSQKVIPSALVFVPEGEMRDYERGEVAHLVAVPAAVRGITKTRNWILEWAKERDETRVVMIDDDVKAQGWVELGFSRGRPLPLTEKKWLREWAVLFDLTEDLGFRIWGVATMNALRAVYPWKPFLERNYVTASCMGLRNETGIRFDESYPVKEDYEITLRCIKEDGGVLAARHLFWANSHWNDEGGCRPYRTSEMEDEIIQRLLRAYPGMIRKVTRGGSDYSVHLDF
jgi:hypothetical protein